MKFLVLIACLLLSAPAFAKPKPSPAWQRTIQAGGHSQHVVVEVTPSRPNARGAGQCGAGEEVTLKIFVDQAKKPALTKLIESCLETWELRNGKLGQENGQSLSAAISVQGTSIQFDIIREGISSRVQIELASGTPEMVEAIVQGAKD